MKKLLLLSSVCFSTIMLWAAATPQCNVRVNNEQDGRKANVVYFSWETDLTTGDVLVSVNYDDKTAWRGRGLADDVTSAKGFTLTINGEAKDIAEYFEKDYTKSDDQSKAPTIYRLKLKNGKTPFVDVPKGSTITLDPTANICWWTANDNNGWAKKKFEYLYGYACQDTMAAQTQSLVIEREFTSDTYQGDPNAGKNSKMYMTIQTHQDYTVRFYIHGIEGDNGVSYRTNYNSGTVEGLGTIDNFTYGESQSLADYFTLITPDYGQTGYLLPKDGMQLPLGTEITFNGTVQWRTAEHSNCYKKNVTMNYIYGTSCKTTSSPTALRQAELPTARPDRFMLNGRFVILRDGMLYDAFGRQMR